MNILEELSIVRHLCPVRYVEHFCAAEDVECDRCRHFACAYLFDAVPGQRAQRFVPLLVAQVGDDVVEVARHTECAEEHYRRQRSVHVGPAATRLIVDRIADHRLDGRREDLLHPRQRIVVEAGCRSGVEAGCRWWRSGGMGRRGGI